MPDPTQSGRPTSRNVTILKELLAFLAPYRWQVLAAFVVLTVTAGVMLSLGQGLRFLIDEGFGTAGGEQLRYAIGVFIGLAFLLAIGTFARFTLVSWIGERFSADLRRAVFNHVIELHPGYFETNLSGEIQSRITTDTTLIQTLVGSSISFALRNFFLFVGGVIWLFITNPKLTAVVLLGVPLVMLPITIVGRKVRRLARSSQDKIAGVGSFVGEAVKNVKVVQAFNHQRRDQQQFGEQVEAAFQIALRRIYQRGILSGSAIFLVLSAIAVMLWVGGNDVLAGRISAGELAAFLFYAVMVAASVGAISEVWGDLLRAAGAAERLLELLRADNEVQPPARPQHLPEPVSGQLSLREVSFYYPSRPEHAAIDHLSLEVPAGSATALVGSSGAGKSTLIDLLLRFYDVSAGTIYFDGVDIRQLDPAELRAQIALVPQQPVLFSTSVMENIRYGQPDADDEAVYAAARAAFAHDFITALPEGYDSFIGEAGIRLSGGQRQRVAIARAILKDPKLLLLDEATSALDAESEYQVQQALESLMRNRTTIVIAHRLATVVNVDTIAVLDHGRLVATGSHRELIASSPLYARWASLQFDGEEPALRAAP